MYSNPFQYGNSYPTATQPYGYSMPQNFAMPQQQAQPTQTTTNKIYVSGIEDVRQRNLPFNSDVIFLDNDKPILYQKIVDGKGQFEVKAFSITPYIAQEIDKTSQPINLSGYAKTSDLEPIKAELEIIKEKLFGKVGE